MHWIRSQAHSSHGSIGWDLRRQPRRAIKLEEDSRDNPSKVVEARPQVGRRAHRTAPSGPTIRTRSSGQRIRRVEPRGPNRMNARSSEPSQASAPMNRRSSRGSRSARQADLNGRAVECGSVRRTQSDAIEATGRPSDCQWLAISSSSIANPIDRPSPTLESQSHPESDAVGTTEAHAGIRPGRPNPMQSGILLGSFTLRDSGHSDRQSPH